MARLISPRYGDEPQNEGERRVVKFLMDSLPPENHVQGWDSFGSEETEYIIISNHEIPDNMPL